MKKKFIIGGIAVVVVVAAIVAVLLLTGKKVTISFDTDGGSSVSAIKVKKGESITLPETEKEGYNLDGWFLNEERVTDKTTYDKDTTLKAKWMSKDAKTFTVTFDTDGGSKIDSIKVECGKELILPTDPSKSGYTFVSWVDKNDTTILNKALLTCEDITLKATWKKEEAKPETKKQETKTETKKQETKTDTKVEATSISLNKKSVDLVLGKSSTLVATVQPSNASNKTISWSSNDNSVITVDNKGNITAKKIGSATITAKTSNGKTATAVVYSDVSSVSISATKTYISKYGGTSATTITVTTSPAVDGSFIKWNAPDASGANAAAYFNDSGKSATITARDAWGTNPSQIPVTVSVGRKTSNKVLIYVEPKLEVSKGQDIYSNGSKSRVNSNIDVDQWDFIGVVNIWSDMLTKAKRYVEFYSVNPSKTKSTTFKVQATTKAGQIKYVLITLPAATQDVY